MIFCLNTVKYILKMFCIQLQQSLTGHRGRVCVSKRTTKCHKPKLDRSCPTNYSITTCVRVTKNMFPSSVPRAAGDRRHAAHCTHDSFSSRDHLTNIRFCSVLILEVFPSLLSSQGSKILSRYVRKILLWSISMQIIALFVYVHFIVPVF